MASLVRQSLPGEAERFRSTGLLAAAAASVSMSFSSIDSVNRALSVAGSVPDAELAGAAVGNGFGVLGSGVIASMPLSMGRFGSA